MEMVTEWAASVFASIYAGCYAVTDSRTLLVFGLLRPVAYCRRPAEVGLLPRVPDVPGE